MLFAKIKSDLQFSTGFFYSDYDYQASGYRFTDSDFRGLEFSVFNYNFVNEHIGFFEKLSWQEQGDSSFELLLGPAFGFDINSFLRLQASPVLRIGHEIQKDQVLATKYNNSNFPEAPAVENKLSLGLGTSFEFKMIKSSFVSPVIGLDFTWSFFAEDLIHVKGDSELYNMDFNEFSLITFQPFVGISFNFK